MATAKKTSSGMWKCRVYSHTTPDGKKHYRAFTAPTKSEAERQAAKFSGKNERIARADLTVKEAISRYISAKENVLSPSTIRAYRIMEKSCYDYIGAMKISRLTSEQVQIFISSLSEDNSPKYVRNIYGLFSSAISLYIPDVNFRVTLPARQKKRRYAPSDSDIKALFDASPKWMQIAITLAAFGSCRRGEVCALKYGDIEGHVAHVHADIVLNTKNKWVYKEMPKTADSFRDIPLDDAALQLIGTGAPDAYIVGKSPTQVSVKFTKLRDSLGLDMSFHSLRRYYASVSAALGIPLSYTERAGGWRSGSPTVKEVYQKPIIDYESQFSAKLSSHFGTVLKSMTQSMTQD